MRAPKLKVSISQGSLGSVSYIFSCNLCANYGKMILLGDSAVQWLG